MKIVASIEARMGSSRLPGKVLKNFGEETTLSLLVKRLQKSKYLNDIVVATSVNSKDDLICNWCLENNISFFRGSEDDVVDSSILNIIPNILNSTLRIINTLFDSPFSNVSRNQII